jgi:hypothetical protein
MERIGVEARFDTVSAAVCGVSRCCRAGMVTAATTDREQTEKRRPGAGL